MPYNDPDPSDPNVLVGVELEVDEDAAKDMAYVFAEEFARLGMDKDKLMGIFSNCEYAGAHRAYLQLGENEIETIVDECISVWGSVRIIDRVNNSDLHQE
ncbi:MAG: hypothetical protein IIA58_03060 [Candidatus Marinimicrobia bacterium]|nr:hypothetical protein [Candidatus Neomarinimicrobiota bacterium]